MFVHTVKLNSYLKLVDDFISNLHSNGFRVKTFRNQLPLIHPPRARLSRALHWLTPWLQGLTLLLCALYISVSAAAPITQPSSSQLDTDYQRITTRAYRELTKKNPLFALPQPKIKTLLRQVERADQENNVELTVGLIAANLHLLQKDFDAEAAQRLTRLLLKHHAVGLANEVLEITRQGNDDYALARQDFEFAKYLAAHENWQAALSHLNAIDIANTLPRDTADQAFILLGAALQDQKKHRDAINYYERIKPESPEYRVAQLNLAVAYIRQDWWTDTHIAINRALKKNDNKKDELTNRLYTVLGFSQLQHGFYRDSRESFRNVHLKSIYSNRALLGLGLAALHQEDFIGALNAFNHLKQRDANDVSVSESYLLSAFALMQLKQSKTASASYTEAITFYEQKSAYYQALISTLNDKAKTLSARQQQDIKREAVGSLRIVKLASQQEQLEQLAAHPLSTATKKAVDQIEFLIAQEYRAQVQQLLTHKQAAIDSYLSQARFGLARLFDANDE